MMPPVVHRGRTPAPADSETLRAAANPLGMYDLVGGGFHRYSTDGAWLLPHFEKMLYDQASLARAYVEAYQATGDTAYAEAAHAC